MVYITVMQSPIYHQMTLEEFLFQNFQAYKCFQHTNLCI